MNADLHESEANEIVGLMAKTLNSVHLEHHVKDRSDGPYLVIDLARPVERFFEALRVAQAAAGKRNSFRQRAAISARAQSPADRLSLPETQLLKSTLSEVLTVDRHSFSSNFFGRYVRSVFGYEDQIVSAANHLVYGRRGSGKSSLLAYSMHKCREQNAPYAWIDMQAYAERNDIQVEIDVLEDVIGQLAQLAPQVERFGDHEAELEGYWLTG